MSEAGNRQDSPNSNIEPFVTASSPDEFVGPTGQIGPYKILRTLGEGGFGIVYLAERREPVKQQVALKVIKPGMDSQQVITRFEAERQALALLDHPNIAHVFDAGTTQHGRPYFVMEHVKGVPITDHCDRERLSVEDRLQLFRQVCDAIQHAHQKGIIHRDIKPTNILVTIHENKPRPMVIDFGVAKAVAQRLTEKTLFTEQGQLVGTPEYMSPEQAEMSNLDIDTRSDIYSLGVLLYELLTGALPFDPGKLRKAAIGEIQRIIREEEAPRPSTRLSSLGEQATKVAERRRTQVVNLTRRLQRELEWIPLKAMRKERTRRYQSASELADDIENYLNGVPLIAGPESSVYRIKKFVRRNNVLVAAISAVVMVLIVGSIVSTAMYLWADRARENESIARVDADQARIAAEEALETAEVAREAEAQQKAEALKQLVDHYEVQGRQSMESGQLDDALVFLNEAYQLDSQRYSLRFLLAETQRRLNSPVFLENKGPMAWEQVRNNIPAEHFVFNTAGDRLVAGCFWKYFGLWDTTTGKMIEDYGEPHGGIVAAKYFGGFGADGTRFLVLPARMDFREGNRVQLCASSDGHLVATLPGNIGCFSASEKYVITLAKDKQFRIFDATNGQPETVLKANRILYALWAGDGPDKFIRNIRVFGRRLGLYSARFTVGELAQMSSDGLQAVTIGDPNGIAHVWDVRTGECRCSIEPQYGDFIHATFSPGGHLLLTSRIAFENEPIPRLVSTKQKSWAVSREDSNDPNVTDNSDREKPGSVVEIAEIWSLDQGKRLAVVGRTPFGPRDDDNRKIHLTFSPDGTTATSDARGENRLNVWDTETGALLWQAATDSGTYSPDGRQMVIAEPGGHVAVCDIRTGQRRAGIVGHTSQVNSIRFHSQGDSIRIVTEDASGTCMVHTWPRVELLQERTEAEVLSLQVITSYERNNPSETLIYSPCGDRVAIVGASGKSRIVPTHASRAGFSQFSATGSVSLVSPDRRLIALVDRKKTTNTISVFDTSTGEQQARWEFLESPRKHHARIHQPVFTPPGRHIIIRSLGEQPARDTLRVLDVQTGQVVLSVEEDSQIDKHRKHLLIDGTIDFGAESSHRMIYVSPDGKSFALLKLTEPPYEPNGTGAASQVQLWDIDSGQLRTTIKEFDSPIGFMAFTPDSEQVLTAARSGLVQLWDTRTGQLAKTTDIPYGVRSRFSPDGKRMLWHTEAYDAGELQLWDTKLWREVATFQGSGLVKFSPDSRLILTRRGRLWDTADGRFVTWLPRKRLGNAYFTPCSKRLITRHGERMSVRGQSQLNLWNLEDTSLVYALPPEEDLVVTDISPDGRWFITRSESNPRRTKIRDVATGHLLASYCVPSDELARFNADCSRLITGLGLRDITLETRSPEMVNIWVRAHVPRRLTGGGFRSATIEEMHQAELDFRRYTLGEGHPETRDSQRSLMSLRADLALERILVCIESGELEVALEQVQDLPLWPRQQDTVFYRDRQDAIRLLAGTCYGRGKFNENKGKYAEAIVYFETAVRFDPGYAPAFNALAWLQTTCPKAEFHNGDKAVANAEKAVEAAPENGNYWNTLGAARYRAGQYEKAVEALNKSMELRSGGDALDFFFLAMAQQQLGREQPARQWYNKAVQWMQQDKTQSEELRSLRAEASGLLNVGMKADNGKRHKAGNESRPITADADSSPSESDITRVIDGNGLTDMDADGLLEHAVDSDSLLRFSTGKMVGWWTFDEDIGAQVSDSSGNGHEGTLVSPARIVADVQRGNVLSLAGDGFVDCGNDAAFDITDAITIACWIKVNAFDKAWQAIVTKGDTAWRLARKDSTNMLAFHCTGIKSSSKASWGGVWHHLGVEGRLDINDGKWHHVTAVYDGKGIYLYVDGTLDHSEVATGSINTNSKSVYIGANADTTGRCWRGLIDDVRLYNYALREAEIKALYAGQDTAPAKGQEQ